MRVRLTSIVVLMFAVAWPAAAAARPLRGTPVPAGFVGVNLDGPLLTPEDNVPFAPQLLLMAQSGVESVRATFAWSDEQPYQSFSQVPAGQVDQFDQGAGNVPTNFSETDQLVGEAAVHGISLLPTVMFAPSWDAAHHAGNAISAPRSNQPYADYLTTLIERYGPNGSFWSANPQLPKRPIRSWEVWNEPWIYYYWPFKHYAPTYVALLRAAHAAIKRADPGAKVVLGGIPNGSWINFRLLVSQHGARGQFDVVDVHPYTAQPAGDIEILSLLRRAMDSTGYGRIPMIAGELSWNSSLHETKNVFDWDTTASGQAQAIRTLLPLLAANRSKLNLVAFYWYTWIGNQYRGGSPWGFAGLLGFHRGNLFSKPALSAFSQKAHLIEG